MKTPFVTGEWDRIYIYVFIYLFIYIYLFIFEKSNCVESLLLYTRAFLYVWLHCVEGSRP